jgi:hypothetical protein
MIVHQYSYDSGAVAFAYARFASEEFRRKQEVIAGKRKNSTT